MHADYYLLMFVIDVEGIQNDPMFSNDCSLPDILTALYIL